MGTFRLVWTPSNAVRVMTRRGPLGSPSAIVYVRTVLEERALKGWRMSSSEDSSTVSDGVEMSWFQVPASAGSAAMPVATPSDAAGDRHGRSAVIQDRKRWARRTAAESDSLCRPGVTPTGSTVSSEQHRGDADDEDGHGTSPMSVSGGVHRSSSGTPAKPGIRAPASESTTRNTSSVPPTATMLMAAPGSDRRDLRAHGLGGLAEPFEDLVERVRSHERLEALARAAVAGEDEPEGDHGARRRRDERGAARRAVGGPVGAHTLAGRPAGGRPVDGRADQQVPHDAARGRHEDDAGGAGR